MDGLGTSVTSSIIYMHVEPTTSRLAGQVLTTEPVAPIWWKPLVGWNIESLAQNMLVGWKWGKNEISEDWYKLFVTEKVACAF